MRIGHEFVHSIVDDHSRVAYSELHGDERAPTVVAFVERALRFFAAHGIAAERLMSDNHWSYTHTRALRERQRIRHLSIEERPGSSSFVEVNTPPPGPRHPEVTLRRCRRRRVDRASGLAPRSPTPLARVGAGTRRGRPRLRQPQR